MDESSSDASRAKKRKTNPNSAAHIEKAWEARRKDIDSAEVMRLSNLGLSVQLIADILEISKKTLDRRLKKDHELAEALRSGRQTVRTQLRAALIKQALGGNTRILLRMAESEGVLKPVGIALQGKDGKAIEHNHSATSDAVFEQFKDVLSQVQDAARADDGASHAAEVAEDGTSEAAGTDG